MLNLDEVEAQMKKMSYNHALVHEVFAFIYLLIRPAVEFEMECAYVWTCQSSGVSFSSEITYSDFTLGLICVLMKNNGI